MVYTNGPLPALSEVGFSVYSESDEDGILHYIFSVSGEATKKLIDLGAGGIEGSNTANLLINHGWSGLLVDADNEKVQSLQAFYTGARATRIFPPTCICAQLTAENVNAILLHHGYAGEIDLLCIDIDGIDYWIWKATYDHTGGVATQGVQASKPPGWGNAGGPTAKRLNETCLSLDPGMSPIESSLTDDRFNGPAGVDSQGQHPRILLHRLDDGRPRRVGSLGNLHRS